MAADRLRFSLMANNYMKNHRPCTENYVFSPLSAEIALSMAYIGAKGKTRQEIADVLCLNPDAKNLELCGILQQIKKDEIECVPIEYQSEYYHPHQFYTLYMANGVFADELFKLNESYREDVKSLFDATCFSARLVSDPNEAAQQINEYIEKQTMQLLRDVVSLDDFTPLTRLVLVNALYFKSNWEHQFHVPYTVKKPFMTATGAVSVDMMIQTTRCNYFKSKELGGAKFLEMAYSDNVCSAIFVLPGKRKLFSKQTPDQGLNKLTELLTPSALLRSIQSMYTVKEVDIQLPRFRLTQTLDMEGMLSDLGMSTAFSDEADFSGISDSKLRIDKAKQMAYIDVNEKGTEAAAATAVVMVTCCLLPKNKAKFKANRPFMFFIRHNNSNTILFMGRVSDPINA